MRIGIASHIAIDTLDVPSSKQSDDILGGPPLYCGLLCRRYKFDITLATAVGNDFFESAKSDILLSELGVRKSEIRVAEGKRTTRFALSQRGGRRKLSLLAKCDPVEPNQIQDNGIDAWIVSPIVDEIPPRSLEAIVRGEDRRKTRNKLLVALDPQGFLRELGEGGSVSVAPHGSARFSLEGVDIIKVDNEELVSITGLTDMDGMRDLQSRGVQYVLATDSGVVRLLHRNILYRIKIGTIQAPDSTGAGDILLASFTCSLLREKDPLWAVCFGAGAVRAALETKGIGLAKVPLMSKIEQNASYFYNTVSFEQL